MISEILEKFAPALSKHGVKFWSLGNAFLNSKVCSDEERIEFISKCRFEVV